MSAEDFKTLRDALLRGHSAACTCAIGSACSEKNTAPVLAVLARIEAEAARMADLLIDAETREAMSDAELERLQAEAKP